MTGTIDVGVVVFKQVRYNCIDYTSNPFPTGLSIIMHDILADHMGLCSLG